MGDLRSSKLRFLRNGFYRDSPLFTSGRDLELFSALLYLKAIAEEIGPNLTNQPGLETVAAVINDAVDEENVRLLQEHAYLRIRLVYLLASLGDTATKFQQTNLLTVIARLSKELSPSIADQLHASVDNYAGVRTISAWLGGDVFRLPYNTDEWNALAYKAEFEDGLRNADIALGSGQTMLFASPRIRISEGESRCSPRTGVGGNEFIHFALRSASQPVAEISNTKNEDLTAVVRIKGIQNDKWQYYPVPAVVETCGTGVHIRINCLDLLAKATFCCPGKKVTTSNAELQIAVLKA
jgi:hypothetical protein